MNLRSTKFALLLGLINGILFFLVYQPVKVAYVKYLWSIKNDNYVYVVLPQIYRIAQDVGEFFVWTALFMLSSYTVHRFWATNLKSTIALWLRVAIVSLAVPIIGLWLFPILIVLFILILRQFEICFFPLNCHTPSEELLSFLIREPVDIKFEILLLIAAFAVNFIFGVIISRLSRIYPKNDPF